MENCRKKKKSTRAEIASSIQSQSRGRNYKNKVLQNDGWKGEDGIPRVDRRHECSDKRSAASLISVTLFLLHCDIKSKYCVDSIASEEKWQILNSGFKKMVIKYLHNLSATAAARGQMRVEILKSSTYKSETSVTKGSPSELGKISFRFQIWDMRVRNVHDTTCSPHMQASPPYRLSSWDWGRLRPAVGSTL